MAKDSTTATYAAVKLHIHTFRWAGVPFFIRTGKCMPLTATEVQVTLRGAPLTDLGPGRGNRIRFRLSDPITLGVEARVLNDGSHYGTKEEELSVVYTPNSRGMADYERLLTDAMRGEATLFARQDTVETSWGIVDPILEADTPVHTYQPTTWGPREADALTHGFGGWHTPKPA